MASTSDRKAWEAQAAFMRDVGALHAEWAPNGELLRLTLEPRRPIAPASLIAADQKPPPQQSPAKRLMQMHETQFAASRYRPPFVAPAEITDVPRAVRAKEAARGSKKVSKRGS